MGLLKKADYYYGSLLSVLVNSEITPALFENENENRQIYKFSTNRGNYLMYAKYNTSPKGTKSFNWSFIFSEKELSEICKLKDREECLIFALICSQKKLNDYNQEIAIVYFEEFLQCVDLDKNEFKGPARLSVKLNKGARSLKVYGIKLANNNTIPIDRNRLLNL